MVEVFVYGTGCILRCNRQNPLRNEGVRRSAEECGGGRRREEEGGTVAARLLALAEDMLPEALPLAATPLSTPPHQPSEWCLAI